MPNQEGRATDTGLALAWRVRHKVVSETTVDGTLISDTSLRNLAVRRFVEKMRFGDSHHKINDFATVLRPITVPTKRPKHRNFLETDEVAVVPSRRARRYPTVKCSACCVCESSAQLSCILSRRASEESFELTAELRGAFVADGGRSRTRIVTVVYHKQSCPMKADALEILQR
jgi:hypothetical protein